MSIANDVWETTNSTGNGDLTLDGAKNTDSVTFNSALGTNIRFQYTIIDSTNGDRERGIGYLSDATTLVRESPCESTNNDSAVVFGSGTKDVFIAASTMNSGATFHSISDIGAGNAYAHGGATAQLSGGGNLNGNLLWYTSLIVNWTQAIDGIIMLMDQTRGVSSDTVLAGVYDRKADGTPGNLIVQADTKFDPSIQLVDQVVSCPRTKLAPGYYFYGTWGNIQWRPRMINQTYGLDFALGYTSNNGSPVYCVNASVTSLSSLPTVAPTPTASVNNARPPTFRFRFAT